MKQNNETVLLTGASQGIGYAVLDRLLVEGYKVVATDRCIDALETKLDDFKQTYGDQLDYYAIDLLDPRLAQQVAQLCREYQFDHFVSCAGVLSIGNVHAMAAEDIRQMFDINTFGALTMIQQVAEGMKHRQSGSIVVIGSNSANTPRLNIGAYAASKSALHMLVKCCALELAEYGIRCNIVSPGSTRTEMQTQLWRDNYGEQQVIEGNLEQYRLGIPLSRIAEPADIAKSVLFLLSDAARQITMHDLRVDGGATLDN
ncbi:2,3-dihydro-2,3-dihydroxybenzoate dehydrogenase [Vibrio gazogenes]|uniref:2,3-dihydro-2,3-dihydroxybenzoate dehydrogenase n=1 Tax=Vibrio gazogenes DSM 21264 = NBRC 103151 TaxID=1123492 RepID=A0A1M4YDX4_VIBGA|nr:2,3-dihydro-2,3-dihydroxybenzoate dehydrogenase [Vibrio gazogenes]USP14951.1 2,3-dihydro-2,3-dihydroxybenzoate dehydrogenase [Vibrio gazogenes]SHF03960.1 2,3-dihydro-2,3-dihydroxybenzoate dehydrogenase [Vibrio gazogenes DSM 21264] [Vibrio gazogenes DSM 21264 = NBRC 103151]SJN55890.1 2,3-dihydro-2,3-dihydroxybenzoate dehydrogenase [Vibrio gazogenes]